MPPSHRISIALIFARWASRCRRESLAVTPIASMATTMGVGVSNDDTLSGRVLEERHAFRKDSSA